MNTGVTKIISIIIIVLTLTTILCACGGDSSIVGRWENDEETIEFLEDGTLIVEGMSGSYSISDDRLSIQLLWAAQSYDYDISGDTLTLTENGGSTEVYTRCDD